MKLRAQKWKFSEKCLFFVIFVPKVCKSANYETKMFLGHFGHVFMFVSEKSDPLIGKLKKKISAFGLEF